GPLRGGAGRSGHPRPHDRGPPLTEPTTDRAVVTALGDPGPEMPRRNGELVFDAPWQARIFGLAAAYLTATGRTWEPFRQRLIAAIAAAPEGTPYFDAFTTAFESLLEADRILP